MNINVPRTATVLLALATPVTLAFAIAAPVNASSVNTSSVNASSVNAAAVAIQAEQHKMPRAVRLWAAAWNAGDASKMAALFSANGVYQDNAFQVAMRGQKGVKTWVTITSSSFKNVRVELVDAFRAGDRIAVRWNFSGTDIGAVAKDRPATGKSFTVPATTIMDLKGDKIRKLTDYYNLADLLRQAGLPADAWTPPGQ